MPSAALNMSGPSWREDDSPFGVNMPSPFALVLYALHTSRLVPADLLPDPRVERMARRDDAASSTALGAMIGDAHQWLLLLASRLGWTGLDSTVDWELLLRAAHEGWNEGDIVLALHAGLRWAEMTDLPEDEATRRTTLEMLAALRHGLD